MGKKSTVQSKKKITAEDKPSTVFNKVKGVRFNFFTSFAEFIKEYGVVGMAIGIVIGSTVSKYVTSLVENIVSPLIGMILSVNSLASITFGTETSKIRIGSVISSTIELFFVLLIIFFTVKYVLKFLKLVEDKKEIEEKAEKKK